MKKRPYRSKKIKEIEPKTLVELRGREVVVGVDVAKENQRAALWARGEPSPAVIVSWNHPNETAAFLTVVGELEPKSLEFVLEPSGSYSRSMFWQFSNVRGASVFSISGKKTHDASELFDGVASSHDSKSAALLADLHMKGLSRPFVPRTAERRDLQAYAKTLCRHTKHVVSMVNELESILSAYWPGVATLLDLQSLTLLALLAQFPGAQEVAQRPAAARALMRRVGRSFLKEETIEKVLVSARECQAEPMTSGEQRRLQTLVAEMAETIGKERVARREVEEQAAGSPTVQNLAPLTGKATAAVIVAGLGEASDYPNAGSYLKAAGLNLKVRSSGKHNGELKLTKRGPSNARQWVYLFALRLLQADEIVRAWYAAKVQRDGGKKKGKALIALMRKLMRALWHIGSKGGVFDAARLFDARRLDLSKTRVKVTGTDLVEA